MTSIAPDSLSRTATDPASIFAKEYSEVKETSGYLPTQETIVINEKTGGRKASKLQRYDLIPWEAMDELAAVYGFGATKYAPHNWRKGYDWGLSYASLIRHAKAFWEGEELDPESGLPHMAHAAWHCLTLLTFMQEHPDLDDRFTYDRESEG